MEHYLSLSIVHLNHQRIGMTKTPEQQAIQLIKIFAPLGLIGCPLFLFVLVKAYFRDHDPIVFPVMGATIVGWIFDFWVCRKYLGWFEKK